MVPELLHRLDTSLAYALPQTVDIQKSVEQSLLNEAVGSKVFLQQASRMST